MRSRITARRFIQIGVAFWMPLVVFWIVPAEAGRIKNEPNGFNGYTWGFSIAQYPSLQRVTDPAVADPLPFVDVYENPGEVLTLNGVTFSKIYYRFYKSKLGNIQLTFEGLANRDKLMQWAEETYGKLPPPERKQINLIEWHGNETVISLGYSRSANVGRLWFTYLPLTPFDNSTTDTSGY